MRNDKEPNEKVSKEEIPNSAAPDTTNCSSSYFERVYRAILDLPCFESRGLRAGKVPNFMHGLSLNKVYPFSPFTAKIDAVAAKDGAEERGGR